MIGLDLVKFTAEHADGVISCCPVDKAESFFNRLIDAGQVIPKFHRGALIGFAAYYRTCAPQHELTHIPDWTLPEQYSFGPYVFVDLVVIHPKYRKQRILEYFVDRIKKLKPYFHAGFWLEQDGVWHAQERAENMQSNCGILAFDKITGMLNGRANVISLSTLARIAQDNEFLLFPMKVASEELSKLAYPFILNNDFHFETITNPFELGMFQLPESCYVLSQSDSIGELVDDEEAKTVRGSKKFWKQVIAPIFGMGGGAGVGALLGSAIMPGIGTLIGAGIGGAAGGAMVGPMTGRAPTLGETLGGGVAGLAGSGVGNWLGGAGGAAAGSGIYGAAFGGAAGGLTSGAQSNPGKVSLGNVLGTGLAGAAGGALGGGLASMAMPAATTGASLQSMGPSFASVSSVPGMSTAGGGGAGGTLGMSGSGMMSGLGNSLISGANTASTNPLSSGGQGFSGVTSYGQGIDVGGINAVGSPLGTGDVGSTFANAGVNGMGINPGSIASGGSGSTTATSSSMGGGGQTGAATGTDLSGLTQQGAQQATQTIAKEASAGSKVAKMFGGPGGMLGLGLTGVGMLGQSMNKGTDLTMPEDLNTGVNDVRSMIASGGATPQSKAASSYLATAIPQGPAGAYAPVSDAYTQAMLNQMRLSTDQNRLNYETQLNKTTGGPFSSEYGQQMANYNSTVGTNEAAQIAAWQEAARKQGSDVHTKYLELAAQGDQVAYQALLQAYGDRATTDFVIQQYRAGQNAAPWTSLQNLGGTLAGNAMNPLTQALMSRIGG
jgi:hypothetical protein